MRSKPQARRIALWSLPHSSPAVRFTSFSRRVVRIVAGAVTAEAVGEVILPQIYELGRAAVAGIVDGVNAIAQATVVDTAAGRESRFLFVEISLKRCLFSSFARPPLEPHGFDRTFASSADRGRPSIRRLSPSPAGPA